MNKEITKNDHELVSSRPLVLKSLSETLESARHDAIKALKQHYIQILKSYRILQRTMNKTLILLMSQKILRANYWNLKHAFCAYFGMIYWNE